MGKSTHLRLAEITVKSRFYVKSQIYVAKSDDKISNLINIMSQFYVMSRFYVTFPTDQQYRKIEI